MRPWMRPREIMGHRLINFPILLIYGTCLCVYYANNTFRSASTA